MSWKNFFLIFISVVVLFIGVGLLFGGAALRFSDTFFRDQEGFYTTRDIEIIRDTYAVTTYPAQVSFGPVWFLDWPDLLEVKVEARNLREKKVFLGIAEEQDLQDYLSGVAHDEIDRLDLNHPFGTPDLSFREFQGQAPPTTPSDQNFWVASKSGEGSISLRWGLQEGRYSVVLMNEDGSSGLDLRGSVGVKLPRLAGIGLGLLLAGVILSVFSFLLVYVVITRSRI